GSAAMLLAWLGERRGDAALGQAAQAIEAALDRVIADPATRTPDMGGTLGSDAFAAAVIKSLSSAAS
ncbi:MAG: isocitrate/isopropylmalate dehydrogenase family protein, partial [Rhodospirillales bacterium]|nr:isocitrate/isopropylmalate dehydrogenase family protein [Rhodospirillales bacterium]